MFYYQVTQYSVASFSAYYQSTKSLGEKNSFNIKDF